MAVMLYRQLICFDCKTLLEVPALEEGTPPDYDFGLDEIVKRHQHMEIPLAERKGGQLLVCDEATMKQIEAHGGDTELRRALVQNHIDIDAKRNELKEDALKCYAKHGGPQQGCIDYADRSKAIGRTENVPLGRQQFLCQHCPVHSYVTTEIRWRKGMYKE